MKILFVFRTMRMPFYPGAKKGEEPDHLLYGMNHLKKMGHKVYFSNIAYNKLNLLRIILFPLQAIILKSTSMGFRLDQALLLIPLMKKSDVIISTADVAGLPILLLKKIKLINKSIVYISVGLVNEVKKRESSLFTKFYMYLLNSADIIICHSNIEKKFFKELIPNKKIYTIQFGIDAPYFKCKKKTSDAILSIGRDRSRDYKLLANVARQLPKQKFVVVTSQSNVKNITFSSNVEVFFDIPYREVKEFYCSSKLVFLPLVDLNRASGQMSLLEAIASGNKVVISAVKGIYDIYKDLIENNKNIFTFKPGNEEEAIKQIRVASSRKTTNYNLSRRLTSNAYAYNLNQIIKNL